MGYKIKGKIAPTFDKLIKTITAFSSDGFNKVPFEGSWTGGQVCEHLRLSTGNLTELLYGNTSETSKSPEEKVPQIADLFLNFETKLQSPDFIYPEMKPYDKAPMIDFFTNAKAKMLKASEELDLAPTCEDFSLPGFGKMTRVEWMTFVLYHIQRHTMQLERILAKV